MRDLARRRDEASARHFPDRIAEVRRELFGDEGIPAIADALHLPHRTWMNYEQGVVMPATVLLRFLDLTMVEPHWLLTGRGPKYQGPRTGSRALPGDGTILAHAAHSHEASPPSPRPLRRAGRLLELRSSSRGEDASVP